MGGWCTFVGLCLGFVCCCGLGRGVFLGFAFCFCGVVRFLVSGCLVLCSGFGVIWMVVVGVVGAIFLCRFWVFKFGTLGVSGLVVCGLGVVGAFGVPTVCVLGVFGYGAFRFWGFWCMDLVFGVFGVWGGIHFVW